MAAPRAFPWAFLLAFGAGSAFILCVRFLWPSINGAIAAAAVALGAIAVLWVYYYKYGPAVDRQQASDDLYYLGLLFTLVSMIVALTQLFILDSEGLPEQRANDLIGNFGIALVSTVAGILGRILLQNAGDERPSMAESEWASDKPEVQTDGRGRTLTPAPVDLSADAMKLRRALREATDAFSHFTRVTANQANQTKTHTESLIRKANDDMTAAASRGRDDAAAVWREAVQGMRADAAQLAKQFDGVIQVYSERMAETAKRGLDDVAASWSEAAHAMRVDGEQLAERCNTEMTAAAVRAEGTWRGLAELADAVSVTAQRLKADASEISSMVENTASASRGLVGLAGNLDAAEQKLQTLAQSAAAAATGLDGRAAEIVKAHNELARGAKQYSEGALQEYGNAVSEIAGTAHEQLAGEGAKWLTTVKEFTAAGRVQQELGVRNVEAAQRWGEEMSEEVAQWTTLAERTRKSLVEAVESLTDTVRKS